MLITGSSGFVGGHLVDQLEGCGGRVFGVSRHCGDARQHSSPSPGVEVMADLRDPEMTRRVIRDLQPTHVFHAAGILGQPVEDWRSLYEGNVLTTVNLLDAITAEGLHPWILLTSSSAVYGAGTGQALVEGDPLEPVSWYGVTKAAQELVGIRAARAAGARVIRVRLFNLIGPGQPSSLVISDVARQIAVAERTEVSVVQLGNLEPERDYVDVRDAAAAMVLLAEAGAPSGPYNVASGRARSVRECVDALLRLASKPIQIQTVDIRRRTADIRRQFGDCGRLRTTVSWRPMIELEQSLQDVLDHWRRHVQREANQ